MRLISGSFHRPRHTVRLKLWAGNVWFTAVWPVYAVFWSLWELWPYSYLWTPSGPREHIIYLTIFLFVQAVSVGVTLIPVIRFVLRLRQERTAIMVGLVVFLLLSFGPTLFWFLLARPYLKAQSEPHSGGTKGEDVTADDIARASSHIVLPFIQCVFVYRFACVLTGVAVYVSMNVGIEVPRYLVAEPTIYLYTTSWGALLFIIEAWLFCFKVALQKSDAIRRILVYLPRTFLLCVPYFGGKLHERLLHEEAC